jgi:hypothetical protein
MADLQKEPTQAEPLNFTKYTSFGAVAATSAVAVIAGIRELLETDTNPLVALGIFLAAGLVAIAIAIVAASDVWARAYVTSNTMIDPDDEDKLLPASVVLSKAMDKQREDPKIIPLPRIKGTKVQGESATVLAMRVTGEKTEFQIQRAGGETEWVTPVAVKFPAE